MEQPSMSLPPLAHPQSIAFVILTNDTNRKYAISAMMERNKVVACAIVEDVQGALNAASRGEVLVIGNPAHGINSNVTVAGPSYDRHGRDHGMMIVQRFVLHRKEMDYE
jgi:hypothetical protein